MRYPPALVAAALTAALTAALALTGCSGGATPTPTGSGFNNTDVAFATDMVQHHAQALQMVDLTRGRDLDPAVANLAEDIRDAQAPEIETMTGWLQKWDKPIPETARDHVNAHSDDMVMDSDMPGMMSGEQLQSLKDAEDAEFQQMWLQMMVEHHTGAITMAKTEQDNGENRKSVDLAGKIARAQTKEIAAMQDMLAA